MGTGSEHSYRMSRNTLDGRRKIFVLCNTAFLFSLCDYYPWGHLKQIVYKPKLNTLNELAVNIGNTCLDLKNQLIQNMMFTMKKLANEVVNRNRKGV